VESAVSSTRGEVVSVPVLYIGGCQRSGSTLLDRMMSQIPGHVSAGEVVHIWARGVRDDELCGCGVAFSECPFWAEVGRRAFGGWDQIDIEQTIALQRRVDRNRHIIFMLMPWLSPRYRQALRAYTDVLRLLYRAIAETGGGLVVDSSKHSSTAFLLRRVTGVRLRVIHLVRDSRGVTFSLSKTVRRPEVLGTEVFMHRQTPWRASVEWVAFNLLFDLLQAVGTQVTRVRYEDLIRGPRAALARAVGVSHGSLGFIEGQTVTLGVDHTVAGNPMRFAHGALDLRVDDAWRSEMEARQRWFATVLTAPLLRLYGYRLRAR
jgi:hypothetical protein